MIIEERIALLEDLIAPWQQAIGDDFTAYKNHLYRMVHFCFALRPCSEKERHKVIVAAIYHDLGIWSDQNIDYLPPSVRRATEFLKQDQRESWTEEISKMIDLHHKLRAVNDKRYPLVEVFRKADLVDVSLGMVRFGIPRTYVKRVKQQFPNAGFHKRLMQLTGQWYRQHPISLPPFFKW